MIPLREPQQIELKDKSTFLISKVPCMAAREIFFNYFTFLMPIFKSLTNEKDLQEATAKFVSYKENQEACLKLLSYVAKVSDDGKEIRLNHVSLIENHVLSWQQLLEIEIEMVKYNCDFLELGRILNSIS